MTLSARRLRAGVLSLLLIAPGGCAGPARGPSGDTPALLVSDRAGAPRIYEETEPGAARPIGSAERSGAHSDTMPARLPGGGMVFVSDRDGKPAIYLTTSAGETRRLTFDPPAGKAIDSAPAPLGRDRIVFSRREPGAAQDSPRDLYCIRLDGSALRRLTRHPADDAEPWGSPDGRTVVFVSERGARGRRVWLIPDADAPDPETGAVCLSEIDAPARGGEESFEDSGPVLFSDGSIVFSRAKASGGVPQIFLMGRSGARTGLRQITESITLPFGAMEPMPLDDRTLLLTTGPLGGKDKRSGGGRFVVYRIALGGFNLSRVTREHALYSDFTRRLAER